MASVTPPCIFKSVTLIAGEQFTLPPGAEIVSSTAGVDNIKSTCPLPDTLETPVCYKFRFSGADDDNSGDTENWEVDTNFAVNGIVLSGIYYPFASVVPGSYPATTFQTEMTSLPGFNGLFTSFSRTFAGSGGANRGWTNEVRFLTIPSVGDNLEFKISTRVEFQSPFSGTSTVAYVKGERC
jgi:hypothetical protein